MPDDDLVYQQLLIQRIRRYTDLEQQVGARVRVLQDEFEDLRHRRESAEALYRAEFGDLPPNLTDRGMEGSDALRPTSRIGPYASLKWNEAIGRALAEEQRALHVREIWERLQAGGFTTASKDPLRTIVTIALRTPGIVHAGPNRYALAGGAVDTSEGVTRTNGD
jgi:hypothetical protein